MMSPQLSARLGLVMVLAGCSSDPPSYGDGAPADIALIQDASDVPMASGDVPMAACGVCATPASPETSGTLSSSDLDEISGIAESRSQPGVYFVHNDSGDTARFFSIDGNGSLRGTYVLDGATAVDWEDLAVGPCPAGQCVFLGDIGDNAMVRSGYAVYRVSQPVVGAGPATQRDVTWERFSFIYPDGAHNAEALAVRPDTGDVYVITKVSTGATEVYRFPQPLVADSVATLVRVGVLALPGGGDALVTGADIHPCARRLLVRTYTRLWEYSVGEGAPWEDIFRATPQRVLVSNENQGESVGWHADGRGYVTISEGRAQGLHDARCME
ncbi:MAG: hypothetical protein KA978_07435 [Deltaproteobacteria bacterium]|nr:hypothetical protein [Deltaproteobacteria bacterium]